MEAYPASAPAWEDSPRPGTQYIFPDLELARMPMTESERVARFAEQMTGANPWHADRVPALAPCEGHEPQPPSATAVGQ